MTGAPRDEAEARRELDRALARRHRTVIAALVVIAAALALLIGLTVSALVQGETVGGVVTLLMAALVVVSLVSLARPVDASGPLLRCHVARPHSILTARGLRLRRPDGALVDVPYVDGKEAIVSAGDEVWFTGLGEGEHAVGFAWNAFERRARWIVGLARTRMVAPPGALPRGLAGGGPQDGVTAVAAPVIRPLGPPPPDGVDEAQARAVLAVHESRPGHGHEAASGRLVVAIVTAVTSVAFAPGDRDLVVRYADGSSYGWRARGEDWPAVGASVWSTTPGPGVWVRLIHCAASGDIRVVEPSWSAEPVGADAGGRA